MIMKGEIWHNVNKLENQEILLVNSVQVWKPENKGSWQCNSQSEAEALRTRISDLQGQNKLGVQLQQRQRTHPPSAFCSRTKASSVD